MQTRICFYRHIFFTAVSVICTLHCLKSTAQKIKDETIEYSYLRLPSSPLPGIIKNYHAQITAAFESKNKTLQDQYEADKKRAQEDYDNDIRSFESRTDSAEKRYAREMEEYNKKSLGTKIVEKKFLGENNKPVKQLPSQPYLREVPVPRLQSSYDYPALAATSLHLDGYTEGQADAVKIIVTLYGFDYTQPRLLSEQKDMLSVNSSGTNTYKSNYYHNEFSYRHPMSAKVILPGDKEVLNVIPSQLNIYKVYSTSESENQKQVHGELLVKSAEAKILQDNLVVINNLVNDKFGYSYVKRKAKMYYIKNGGTDYEDLTVAFNEASSGLIMLEQDSAAAATKLLHAAGLWNTALKASDPNNKKARINADITNMVCYNLLEAYFVLKNVAAGREVLAKLNSLSLSKDDRKTKNDFELLYTDLSSRMQMTRQ